ncbi:MAG: hypothetical protein KDC67_07875 [Ignavibacteriae bacterium]|nr:hypothetical protein [Ignavibacteriota bacterium]
MKIKEKIFYILILALFISCNEKQESKIGIKAIKSDSELDPSNQTEKIAKSDNKIEKTKSKIHVYKDILGEDLSEINCYVKNIYRKDNLTFVEIDIVRVEITPEGERTIINENSKIRTYVAGINTIIYGYDCKILDSEELARMDKSLLKNKSIIVVGSSKDGVLESLNFGCYD